MLGLLYQQGQSVPQNYQTAVKWYKLAAEQGHAKAQFLLGVMYEQGQGISQNIIYAYMWFNIAASQGNKDAAKNRDFLAKTMPPAQVEEAQELSAECKKKRDKGC